MQLTLVSSTIFSHRVFSRVFTNSHCPKSCCPSTYTLPNVPAHLWLFHSAAMAGGDVCLGWAFFDNEEKWMGAQFFYHQSELASHFTFRICSQKLVNQIAGYVLCRYSKRYLFWKSKAPAVSPPKLPYPWKCPQPPIKFLPRLPISTFSLCCDTHGSRAPILKDQAQSTLPKMKMLNFENQAMMVRIQNIEQT